LPKADRIWSSLPCDDATVEQLATELDISPVTARLLCIRGLGDLHQARRFLSPSLDDLHDPFALTGMQPAVDRILGAIERRARISFRNGCATATGCSRQPSTA
jgi:single-stranded-DNA-specific exonuclease